MGNSNSSEVDKIRAEMDRFDSRIKKWDDAEKNRNSDCVDRLQTFFNYDYSDDFKEVINKKYNINFDKLKNDYVEINKYIKTRYGNGLAQTTSFGKYKKIKRNKSKKSKKSKRKIRTI